MLKVVYSNDMLQLAAHLASQQQAVPLPPFEPEVIIVQSNELSRWLSLYLASQQGIASHIEFPYPSAYIWRLFREIWPEVPLQSAYSKDALAWRIFQLLPTCLADPAFSSIAHYLQDENDDLKRFQLAERLADSFDQYLMYRPDWVTAWEQGECPNWQATLWHKLTEQDDKPLHRANLLYRLTTLLAEVDSPPVNLPTRLSIFGLSALPPVYLQTFALLARFVDITVYFQSPSEHYWGDLQDKKQQQRAQLTLALEDQHEETGHPLLASLGKQGQVFFRQLQAYEHEVEMLFVPPENDTLLKQLQHDIYSLDSPPEPTPVQPDDSIAFHRCHSPMREIEVLHDQLLSLFERYPDLSATDIVVMTPDIDMYAPCIEAVFGTAKSKQYIPFSIADSRGQQENVLLDSFYRLLQLPSSRFDIESVLTLLACPAIQQRFELDEIAVDWIRSWCQQTRIRWGLDATDKTALDLPSNDANTWRAGLDRLLLGYAMPLTEPGENWRLFAGQLAMDGISGEKAHIVARLCRFIDTLNLWRQKLKQRFHLTDWQWQLNQCLETFFDAEKLDDKQDEQQLFSIRSQLDKLVESAVTAAYAEKTSMEIVFSWLQTHLDPVDSSHRFMGHGVTFCTMVPMRSIPFDVVCLIGMNDDVFPRRQPGLSFDLLTQDYREGDRSRRDDDRYLFLETLLSTQQHLYISYVGASIIDNSEIPPSVLVSDLQDLLDERFVDEDGQSLVQHLVTPHPLQSFSRRYYDGQNPKLFSYNSTYCPPTQKRELQNWFDGVLPEAEDSWRQVSREQLQRFYRHPARFLCHERLNIRLELDDDELDSREPFALAGLEHWQLRQHLLEAKIASQSDDDIKPMIAASGILPHGELGEAWYEQTAKTVDAFVEKVTPNLVAGKHISVNFELDINDFTMNGQIDNLSQQGLLRYRMANKKGKDLLDTWIDHLLLNILQPEEVQLETRLILQDDELLFMPVAHPTQHLYDLLQLYWQGCHQPLKFFDQTSLVYAQSCLGDKPEQALKKAQSKWLGSAEYPGEADDPYHRLVFNASPLDDTFAEIAMQIFSTMQQHVQGGSL